MNRDKSPIERDGLLGHLFTDTSLNVVWIAMIGVVVYLATKYLPPFFHFIDGIMFSLIHP